MQKLKERIWHASLGLAVSARFLPTARRMCCYHNISDLFIVNFSIDSDYNSRSTGFRNFHHSHIRQPPLRTTRAHYLPREDEAKRVNLSYRPYSKGNPYQVIFRLKVSCLLGIMSDATQALLACFRGERINAAWVRGTQRRFSPKCFKTLF